MYINILRKCATRYAPSRILSFGLVHIFKALQLMNNYKVVSRTMLCKELALGEGSIKTLIKHMKMYNLINTSKKGTYLTNEGINAYQELSSIIKSESELPRTSITLGSFNYAVLLKGYSRFIKGGIEQRDYAIRIGALGATTLIYKNGRFIMPSTDYIIDDDIIQLFLSLEPEDGDVIIIGSANDRLSAELGAKNAAINTILENKHI